MAGTDYFTYGAVEAVYDPLYGLYGVYNSLTLTPIGVLKLEDGPGWFLLLSVDARMLQWDELRSIADMLEDLNAELE